ncbi:MULTISPECIES: hypothetical protein [unclassified Pseudomonas]|uniref:hypothetical protein n=1 Tax=unclassified Pseudomonas TaxID=196821 RepID=UPI0020976CFF|nr:MULTISPECIES: hypothetical protein [unclassified Pseudomonas]MCO7519414.1 hypothetical protein [Pseudomonas sp. 1]MCO7541820.1 hypothetical protein [Pseudomonas sp. VA159-2]
MSRPENSKNPLLAQLPSLRPMGFGCVDLEGEAIFRVDPDTALMDGLDLAVSLTEAIHQIAHRLALAANMGEMVRVNELRALAFLADAANTINRSSQVALEQWEVQP